MALGKVPSHDHVGSGSVATSMVVVSQPSTAARTDGQARMQETLPRGTATDVAAPNALEAAEAAVLGDEDDEKARKTRNAVSAIE